MMQLRAITEAEAHSILVRELTGTPSCDQVAEDCALLRSCTWALTEGLRPVHILRLLNLASTLHFCGEAARGQLKVALEELSRCGDLVELSGGQWLPAPTREVILGTADDMRLLVGGFPTSLLTDHVAPKIEHTGPYRRITGGSVAQHLGLATQSLDSWMGRVPEDLREWTQSSLRGDYERYRPTGRTIEVYAPELFPASTPQSLRWVERVEKLTGTHLSREEMPFRGKRCLAVEIEKGQLSGVRAMPVTDFRRLMYGVDLLAGKSVAVEEIANGSDTTVVLRSELPQSEQRLFAAVGRLMVPEAKYYPRKWTFDNQHAATMKERLTKLGVGTFTRAHHDRDWN